MSVTVALSVAELTARAVLIVVLAIVALLLIGWRKPARAEPGSPRGVMERGVVYRSADPAISVEHQDAPMYRRPGIVRRVLAAIASGGLGLLIGVLVAIVLSFGAAMAVIWLTDLLRQ